MDRPPGEFKPRRGRAPAPPHGVTLPAVLLACGSFAFLAAAALAARGPGPRAWGVSLLAFLAPAALVPILLLFAFGLAGLWAGASDTASTVWGRITRRAGAPASRLRAIPPWTLLVPCGAVLWFLRARSHLLGDQLVWIDNIRAGQFPHYSEPLAAEIWRGFVFLLRASGAPVTADTLALLPILCGLLAGVLLCSIARRIAGEAGGFAAAVALLTTLGISQLYFGYIESYPLGSVAVLAYLAVTVPEPGRRSRLFGPILFAACVLSHFVCIYLLPSYVWFALRGRARPLVKAWLLLAPVILVAGALALMGVTVEEAVRPFHLAGGAVQTAGGSMGLNLRQLLSYRRLLDLANLLALVLPFPLIAAVSRLVTGGRNGGPPSFSFLLWAAVPGGLVAAALVVPGSPAQDWDLLAVVVLPLAILAVALAGPFIATLRAPARAGLALLAAGWLLAFVLVNASETAGLKRFESLIAEGAELSPHERAYGNEKLVKLFTASGDFPAVLKYARRSLAAESTNTRYWGNVGTALFNLRRYDEASRHFGEAARRGSERPEVYYNLGQSLMHLGRYGDAVAPLSRAIQLGGEQPSYLFALGLARIESGDAAGGRRAWDHLLSLWPDDVRAIEAYRYYFGRDHRSNP